MKISWRQILIKSFFPVFAAIILVAGIAYAVWTEPTANPPGGNAEAPISVGSVSQYKSGALGIGDLLRGYSNAIFDGNVGIGTTDPQVKLDVRGNTNISGQFGVTGNSSFGGNITTGGDINAANNINGKNLYITSICLNGAPCINTWPVSAPAAPAAPAAPTCHTTLVPCNTNGDAWCPGNPNGVNCWCVGYMSYGEGQYCIGYLPIACEICN